MLQVFPSGPFETNAYVLHCPSTCHAAIIDPAPESYESIVQYIEQKQLTVKLILLTHSHWDHFADLARIKAKYPVAVYAHPLDIPNVEQPGSDGLPMFLKVEPCSVDHLLNDGDLITVGSLNIKVLHTPGHSPGGVCFYCKEHHFLISGDTLFKGTIGNLSFPTSNPSDMWVSLKKLAQLPQETNVYPGHGEPTVMAEETWLEQAEHIFN